MHQPKHFQVSVLLLNKRVHGVVLKKVSENGMCCEHLGDPRCTPPPNIISLAHLYLTSLALMQARQHHESFHPFSIVLQKRFKACLVAKPKQAPEALFKGFLNEFKPLLDIASSFVSIRLWHHELFVQQHDWQVIWPRNFHDLLTGKHFEDRVKDAFTSNVRIRACYLKVISGLVSLAFQEIGALVLICDIDDIRRLNGCHLFLLKSSHSLSPR